MIFLDIFLFIHREIGMYNYIDDILDTFAKTKNKRLKLVIYNLLTCPSKIFLKK
jgi:hypothetical protein